MKKVVEEWKIWNKKEKIAKFEGEAKKIGISEIPQIDLCFWKESKWKYSNKETMESYNRDKEGVCAKKEKGKPIVKKRKKRDTQIY